jgi:MFS family permease
MGDVWGRKPIYFLGMLFNIPFTLGLVISQSAILDYFLLFCAGYSVTMRYYVGYTYNVEMMPKNYVILASTV